MGALFSKWKKSKTTVEVLEQIDKDISKLEKYKRSNYDTEKRLIGRLIFYSIILCIIGCPLLYIFFTPKTSLDRLLQVLAPLCFVFIIYFLKRFLHWWFIRKIRYNETQLELLRDKRKDILENVMETETYKRAKEILEKFDPETKRKLEEERTRRETPQPSPTPGSDLRRRNVSPNAQGQIRPTSQPGSSGNPISPNQRNNVGPTPLGTPLMTNNGAFRGPRPPVILPRPLLDQNRTTMDKVLEYLTGDGPGNRYALICKNCFSHNGMALREEFEFLDYRCGYCRFFNPAKKQRPNAPVLPTRPPPPLAQEKSPSPSPKPLDQDSGHDDSPTSSKESETEHADAAAASKLPEAPPPETQAKKLNFDRIDALSSVDESKENVDPMEVDQPAEPDSTTLNQSKND